MKALIRKYGVEGFGFCWLCYEIVAHFGETCRLKKEKEWIGLLTEITSKDEQWLMERLIFLGEKNFICLTSLKRGDLYIPKLKEYSDDYAKRVRRNSEHNPNNIPLDGKTIMEVRKLYIKVKGFDFKNMTSDDYSRTARSIKGLLIKARGDILLIGRGLQWCSKQNWIDWTLETLNRKWLDFMKVVETKPIKQGTTAQELIEKYTKERG